MNGWVDGWMNGWVNICLLFDVYIDDSLDDCICIKYVRETCSLLQFPDRGGGPVVRASAS